MPRFWFAQKRFPCRRNALPNLFISAAIKFRIASEGTIYHKKARAPWEHRMAANLIHGSQLSGAKIMFWMAFLCIQMVCFSGDAFRDLLQRCISLICFVLHDMLFLFWILSDILNVLELGFHVYRKYIYYVFILYCKAYLSVYFYGVYFMEFFSDQHPFSLLYALLGTAPLKKKNLEMNHMDVYNLRWKN